MSNPMLYPKESRTRRVVDLSGFWKFIVDFKNDGDQKNFKNGLPSECTTIPVPSSFADLFTDRETHEFAGNIWYETSFYLPKEWENREVNARFGCATHKAIVYLNGQEVTSHVGGFVPFNAPLNQYGKFGDENKLVVVVNNELSDTTIPVGSTKTLPDGRKMVVPAFDFFNYSGLNRPVKITCVPKEHIDDVSIVTDINDTNGIVTYEIKTTGTSPVSVKLITSSNEVVGTSEGTKGQIIVTNAKFWNPGSPYLYTLKVTIQGSNEQEPIDEYSLEIGIRTIKVENSHFYINNKPFYFKGFGKHEESDIIGRGYNPAVIKRDFELLKWIHANSFRTSHYPYSEEILQMADREGIVVIDECAAVGLNVMSFTLQATNQQIVPFFQRDTIEETKRVHKAAIEELVRRDKNHACICMWSLLNEPDTKDDYCYKYFKDVFDYTRTLDPQKRPLTYASVQGKPGEDKCMPLVDVICLNRYYGWYFLGGNEIEVAMGLLKKELEFISNTYKNKPIVFTEFGADTMPGVHKLPSTMWSEEYQTEYLQKTLAVFDSVPAVSGEQMWNFADFQTVDGIIRVDANKKGIFTRNRQPKQAAHFMRERWSKLPNTHKA